MDLELDPSLPQPDAFLKRDRELVDAAVERGRICQLYTRGRTALAGSFVVVLITTGYLLYEFPPLWPALWLGTLAVITVLRLDLVRRFDRRARTESSLAGWLHRYIVGCFLGGLAWGAIAAFYPHATPSLRVFIVMILLGIGAGSIITGGVSRACAWLFLLSEMLPLIGVLLVVGPLDDRLLGGLLVVYVFVLLVIARQLRGDLLASLRLGKEKSVLAGRLQQIAAHMEHERDRYATQALSDPLTGLPNRAALERQLAQVAVRTRRSGQLFAVGMLDLDDFKWVNDAFGHMAGDELLRQWVSRFKSTMRETDFLARLGGDEFVILFEGLQAGQHCAQLRAALDRLHQAVEAPFDLGEGRQVQVGMSMGLAISSESSDSDALLRQADVAMYQIKQRKAERDCWWQLADRVIKGRQVSETIVDPFEPAAQTLLSNHQSLIEHLAANFVTVFFDSIQDNPQANEIISCLDEAGHVRLKVKQREHFLFTCSSLITRDALTERSREVGRIHALIGMDRSLLIGAFESCRRLLSERYAHVAWHSSDRKQLLQILIARIALDQEFQLEGMAEISDAYLAVLGEVPPKNVSIWLELAQNEIERIGYLPGIRGALLLRSSAQKYLMVELAAGLESTGALSLLDRPEYQAKLDPNHPHGGGLIARAWRDLHIHSVGAYPGDRSMEPWRDILDKKNIHSVLAIPIRDAKGRAAAVLSLYGGHVHQFGGTFARLWAQGLQYRWEALWQQRETDLSPIPVTEATIWRERLFGDGLALYLQPVVDFSTGRVIQAKAIAQLILPDGRVIAPRQFLPLLGTSEIHQLFSLVLGRALDLLDDWKARGLDWAISIDLPPTCLLETDSVSRLAQRLQSHAGPPSRLILEVIDWEGASQPKQEAALHAIKATGVRLALDDLGAGYISLLHSIHDPLDIFKIGRNLVLRLPQDPVYTLTLLGMLINFARDLDRDLVVEGLDTLALIEVVQQFGVSLGQGSALAPAMPVSALPDWAEWFTLAIHPERITTFAGALTRHWIERHTAFTDSLSHTTCPITLFLKAQGLDDSEPGQWHRCAHAGGKEAKNSSQRLFDWLVVKVMEEDTGGE